MTENKSSFKMFSGPVIVEIEGITTPARFSQLGDGIRALWASLQVLPMDGDQMEAYQIFFDGNVEERVSYFLEHRGELSLTFTMNRRYHSVLIRPEVKPRG